MRNLRGALFFQVLSAQVIFPHSWARVQYRIMDTKAIAEALSNKNRGSFYSLLMQRPAKMLKGITLNIEKRTQMTGQLCDYSVRAAVKNAVADGLRDAPELPSHIEKSFVEGNVRFWQGKDKNEIPGKIYLPMPLAGSKSNVTWLLDGVVVSYDDVSQYLLAADKPRKKQDKEELAEKGQVPFVAVDIENILQVGRIEKLD
jgi:hypothetical protein